MSDTDRLMVSVAGVRGVVGKGLTPEVAARYAAAFGTMAGPGPVVLGRDSRPSGEMLAQAVEAGLRAAGCRVVRIGIVPTPTVQLMVKLLKARGGIAITASHNPPQWNALKFVGRGGCFLDREAGRQLAAIYESGHISYLGYEHLGEALEYDGAIQEHVRRILALPFINKAAIRKKRYTVAVDTCHGAGGPIFGLLLAELGCKAVSLHPEPSGRFSRPIEPTARNLKELETAVRRHRADIGFATDADVDRLAIVTEKGKAAGEELTLALAAQFRLSQKRGPVVTNLSTSRMVDDVASRLGGKVVRTAIGEANVVSAMRKHRAVLGGEGNGGVIIPELNYARDATAAMALMLTMMARSGQPISALTEGIPSYAMVKETVEAAAPAALIRKVAVYYRERPQDHSDGVKVLWDDAWLHVRASGTEPIVRAIAEADRAERALELVRRVRALAK